MGKDFIMQVPIQHLEDRVTSLFCLDLKKAPVNLTHCLSVHYESTEARTQCPPVSAATTLTQLENPLLP